jgi:hypothetical protein
LNSDGLGRTTLGRSKSTGNGMCRLNRFEPGDSYPSTGSPSSSMPRYKAAV